MPKKQAEPVIEKTLETAEHSYGRIMKNLKSTIEEFSKYISLLKTENLLKKVGMHILLDRNVDYGKLILTSDLKLTAEKGERLDLDYSYEELTLEMAALRFDFKKSILSIHDFLNRAEKKTKQNRVALEKDREWIEARIEQSKKALPPHT
jgi:hypothetical protein